MIFGVYKPGQGYWVRALSAAGLGLLGLATVSWVWGQASTIPLPASAYVLTLEEAETPPEPGDAVTLLAEPDELDEPPVEIGRAVTAGFDRVGGSPRLRVEGVEVTAAEGDLVNLTAVRAEGLSPEDGEAVVTAWADVPVVPQIYVQAGVSGATLLLMAALIYWYVGTSRRSVEFLIATDGEMKKVHWSSKREIIGSTQVVIVAAFLIAGLLFGVDTLFSQFFQLVGLLQAA